MRVFVAGGTGAVGRRLIPLLVERGHSGVALTRHAENANQLRGLGADPAVADALALAVERGAPGVYNTVDDAPAPVAEWLPTLARAIGAPRPLHVPTWVGRLLAGEYVVAAMTEIRGASNAKAKRDLGWVLSHPPGAAASPPWQAPMPPRSGPPDERPVIRAGLDSPGRRCP